MFIESEKREESEITPVSVIDANTTMYYVNPPLPGSGGEAERHALSRLPIFAIFHGIAHERGVPPSFTGTLIPPCLFQGTTPNQQNYFTGFRVHPAVASSSPVWHFSHSTRPTCGPRPR